MIDNLWGKLIYVVGLLGLLALLINYFDIYRLIGVLAYFVIGLSILNNQRMMSLFYLCSLLVTLYLSFNSKILLAMLFLSLIFAIGLLVSLLSIDGNKQNRNQKRSQKTISNKSNKNNFMNHAESTNEVIKRELTNDPKVEVYYNPRESSKSNNEKIETKEIEKEEIKQTKFSIKPFKKKVTEKVKSKKNSSKKGTKSKPKKSSKKKAKTKSRR